MPVNVDHIKVHTDPMQNFGSEMYITPHAVVETISRTVDAYCHFEFELRTNYGLVYATADEVNKYLDWY